MERQLQERLIGAAVLIAMAVILVPEMFSGPERNSSATPDAVASDQLRSYEIDLQASSVAVGPAAGQGGQAVVEPPAAEPREQATAPISAERIVQQSSSSSSRPVTVQAAKPVQPTPTYLRENAPPGRFAVQVGSFGTRDKAQQIADKIKSLGLSASVTPIKAGGMSLYRVRTGTLTGRPAAEAALKKLQLIYPDASVVPIS